MLQEERFARILSILEKKGSVTVGQLMEKLGASESTVRRDLNTLDAKGHLIKVHGGAVAKGGSYDTRDNEVAVRKNLNARQKASIARYAAALIEADDVVYIDAGTTTELMIDTRINVDAVYVTNAITHAKKLAALGCRVYILGGEFKNITEAIVGEEAVATVTKYNFTKGFLGTNGITPTQGFTTPEIKEALVKKRVMEHARDCYVLADDSKFDRVAAITFGAFSAATVITTAIPKEYQAYKNIIRVQES